MKYSRKEVVIIAGLVALLVGVIFQIGRTVGQNAAATALTGLIERFIAYERSEAQALRAAFGPDRHSEHVEEWILKDFFKGERDGVFVEVGANHHQHFSNTYYLETELGWSGVAVEPQAKFADGYERYRPRTKFIPLFVSDVSNRQATLYVARNDRVSSGVRQFTETFGNEAIPTQSTTSTLDDILDRAGVRNIDFLSIDIELSEPQALAGFSIDQFAPRLVAIEAHLPVRQQILDYFTTHRYVLLGRYWRADEDNFWFAPLGRSGDESESVILGASGAAHAH